MFARGQLSFNGHFFPGKLFRLSFVSLMLGVPATGEALAARGICSPDTDPAPNEIAPGETTSFNVYFYCLGPGIGNFLSDNLTVNLGKLPKGVTFSPKSAAADTGDSTGTTFTITTDKDTPGGTNVKFKVSAKGKTCASYIPCAEQFTIKPKIKCSKSSTVCPDIWWFNGVDPQPKNYVTKLEVEPKGGQDYKWTIIDGSDFGLFPNNSDSIDTGSKNTVEINPNQDPGGCAICAVRKSPQGGGGQTTTVQVQVKKNGVTSTSRGFLLNANKPNQLQLACTDDYRGEVRAQGQTHLGYRSNLGYYIQDINGKVLPKPVDSNENFVTGITPLDPNANWARHVPTQLDPIHGQTFGTVQDNVGAVVWPQNGVPNVPSTWPDCGLTFPCLSLANHPIDQWGGYIYVGSLTPGNGVPVQKHTWYRLQDHGRHCNLYSPPDSPTPTTPGCPTLNTFCPPPY